MAKDSGALNLFGNMQKPTKDNKEKVKKETTAEAKAKTVTSENKIQPENTPEVKVNEEIKETEAAKTAVKTKTAKKSESKKTTSEPKKLGRPKTLEEEKIRLTVYLTPEIKEKVSKYSTMFPGGISGYIEKAIKKDLEQNESNYESIIKNIMG